MRALLLALILGCPLAARAVPALGPELERPGAAAPAPLGHLVPALALGGVTSPDLALQTARDGGHGGYTRVEPALCLVLGIIPGFGIGHLLAHSRQWVVWLVVDIVIAVLFWGPYWYWPDHPGFFPVLNLLVLVERIFEGISAYQAAGGGRILPFDRGGAALPSAPALAAMPPGRRLAGVW
jgi:hypothetical protein